MTSKTFTANRPATLMLKVPFGIVNVEVDPNTDSATVTVQTAEDHGPSADAVNATTETMSGTTYTVTVPGPKGAIGQDNSVVTGRRTGVFSDRHGNTVVNNNNVSGGGQIISGGDIVVNQRIGVVAPGSHVVGMQIGEWPPPAAPTPVSTTPIRVDVTVPPGTAVSVEGVKTALFAVGRQENLTFNTVTGQFSADELVDVTVDISKGDVLIGRVQRQMTITAGTGLVGVAAYSGMNGTVKTSSGDISITIAENASGPLTLRSLSGDITVTNASALEDIDATTISGQTRFKSR